MNNRVSGDGFKFFRHGGEHTLDQDRNGGNADRTGPWTSANFTRAEYFNPQTLHEKMIAHPEYRMRFADLAYKAFSNGGIFTPEGATQMLMSRANQIDLAIIAESARWGDAKHSDWAHTKDEDWQPALAETLEFIEHRTQAVIQQLVNKGWYPSVAAPSFSIHGGYVQQGCVLEMSTANGSGIIYYTMDGTDPRLPTPLSQTNPQIAPQATVYTGPLSISNSCLVRARIFDNGEWSALNEAAFGIGPVKENLRITELMYNPPKPPADVPVDKDDYEYIELQNIGDQAINLANVKFTNGIYFIFEPLEVQPGQFILVVKNKAAFRSRYPEFVGVIAGEFTGALDNSGEHIELQDGIGNVIHDFKYSDRWYKITDGNGGSLSIRNAADADLTLWGREEGWRASAFSGGSPGFDDPDPAVVPLSGSVVINELLAHSHASEPDWVELHNTTSQAIDIGGWFISDNINDFMKYRIADNTILAPYGCVVLYENQHFGNAQDPGCRNPFAFSSTGESCFLRSGLDADGRITGYYDEAIFGASLTGVAFGRHQKNSGVHDFVAMSANTPGSANAYPKVGPVIISEIMYHPAPHAGYGHRELEYVELHNISDLPVMLQEYDPDLQVQTPWRFGDGIDYTFPLNTTIQAGGYLVVAKNILAFTALYGSLPNLAGPYGGQLDNDGEQLQLSIPGGIDSTGNRCYIGADMVHYKDSDHWSKDADGTGLSLTRIENEAYGNDGTNWQATTPTPGY